MRPPDKDSIPAPCLREHRLRGNDGSGASLKTHAYATRVTIKSERENECGAQRQN